MEGYQSLSEERELVALTQCEKDFEQLFGEYLLEMAAWQTRIESKVDTLVNTLTRFQPLIERYEQASKAGRALAQRKAKKNG